MKWGRCATPLTIQLLHVARCDLIVLSLRQVNLADEFFMENNVGRLDFATLKERMVSLCSEYKYNIQRSNAITLSFFERL